MLAREPRVRFLGRHVEQAACQSFRDEPGLFRGAQFWGASRASFLTVFATLLVASRKVYLDSLKSREKFLAFSNLADSVARMIRAGGFLSEEDRSKLIVLARDGSVGCRVTRRANALVLLHDGWSCQEIANAFFLDDDTIRGWRKLFEQHGIEGITSFDVGGSASYLSVKQEDDLKAWVSAALPRSPRQIGAWIERGFGLVYESRSGLIALLHRLGLEYHKPNVIPRKLNEEKQKALDRKSTRLNSRH